jgi:hypothetical protein
VLVLRGFIKRTTSPAARRVWLFLLFSSDLSAIDFLSCAEFLGPGPFRNLKNSEMVAVPPLFFAVFWLFAVFVTTIATFASGHYAESLSRSKIPEQETLVN